MKVFIGTDHAGFEIKNELVTFLAEKGYEVGDLGPHEYDAQDDYPDFILPVAEAVAENTESRGIILGGSGNGEAMAANTVSGARAMVYYGTEKDILFLGRDHNDANILSLGARFMSLDEAKEACLIFLETPFSGDERHVRRLSKFS